MTSNALEPLFNLWLPALEAGVLSLAELVAWADRQIERLEDPPRWLLELSLSTNTYDLLKAWAFVQPQEMSPSTGHLVPDEVYLGILFLEYKAGRLPLQEMLSIASRDADPPSGDVPSPELVYLLRQELAEHEGEFPSQATLDRLNQLFSPVANKAKVALSKIETTRDSTG